MTRKMRQTNILEPDPKVVEQYQHLNVANFKSTTLADITYIPTGEGWLYLAAVLDMATLDHT